MRKLNRKLLLALAAAAVTAAVAVPLGLSLSPGPAAVAPSAVAPSVRGPLICGQPILHSPWGYDGSATAFTSGQYPGLPTFGSRGTDFPAATRGVIIPAGDNSSAGQAGRYIGTHTVFYFEPGVHALSTFMYTGNHSYYVGGYTPARGEATIDGQAEVPADRGGGQFASVPSSKEDVYNTWKYLTIKNFDSPRNDAFLGKIDTDNGGGTDNGDTYEYDTIGPNEYGYQSPPVPAAYGESSGGGYAMNIGSNTTIEYNCLTKNAQGAINGSNAIGVVIANNEISWNGLGEYPDTPGKGGSPFSCGCSGGFKLSFTVNADVVNNYIHDNYNVGIWFDYDNTGAKISHNYVASNWGYGIDYEASWNADISDNTLIGNAWASDGPWPAGVGGGTCGVPGKSCREGGGVIGGEYGNPSGAVYLPSSGGDSLLTTIAVPATISVPGCRSGCTVTTRYSGHLYFTGNDLINNFGGIAVYTDTQRFPGDTVNDDTCGNPLGALQMVNTSVYWQQGTFLTTGADASISGRSVTTAGGTSQYCDDFGDPTHQPVASLQYQARAPVAGLAVYDMNSGAFLGTVAASPAPTVNAFTLSGSPGNRTHAQLMLSAYGGCGPADYYGSRPGAESGTPSAYYWDHCILGSRNVTVSGNLFSMDATAVSGCTRANLCGFNQIVAFNPGVPKLMRWFDGYPTYIADASGGLGNVFTRNTYAWTSGGYGSWQFEAGQQTHAVTRARWQAAPYGQDAGSTFG